MDYVLVLLAVVLAVVGVIGCVVPIIPGVVLTWVGLWMARMCGGSTVTTAQLLVWLAITVAVTAADYVLPGWMVRRFGGSRAGSMGATVGVIVGMFFGPAGILLGPFLGAVAGECLNDSRDPGHALRVGMGSFAAFVVGTGMKLFVACWMAVKIFADLWPILKA